MKRKVISIRETAIEEGMFDAVIQSVPSWFEKFVKGEETTFIMYRGSGASWWDFENGHDVNQEIQSLLIDAWVEELGD